jgi:uncharacterized protein
MKPLKQIIAESVHPMEIHAQSLGNGHFKIVKVGKSVSVLDVGDEVKSSDLDDLQQAGHKIKELK